MPSVPRFAAHLAEDLSPEDFRHVLTLLRDDLTRLGDVLETAARANDATAFRGAAHGIAGSAGAVGAEALEQSARRAMTRPDDGPALKGMTLERMAVEIRASTNALLTEIASALAETPP